MMFENYLFLYKVERCIFVQSMNNPIYYGVVDFLLDVVLSQR